MRPYRHLLRRTILPAISLLSSFAHAAVYPPQRLDARTFDRIEISGVRGTLRLTGQTGTGLRLEVSHTETRASDDWNLLVEKRGRTLVLEVSNAAYGRQWQAQVRREEWPEFNIALTGPAKPLSLSWRTGRVRLKNWAAPVAASVLDAGFEADAGGAIDLQSLKGDVAITGVTERVRVSGEGGRLRLVNVRAPAELHWLHGHVELFNYVGALELTSQDARVRSTRGAGEWAIDNAGGGVELVDFAGGLKGKGRSTGWQIQRALRAETRHDLEVTSQTGAVVFQDRPGTHAFLTSTRGSIRAPFRAEDRGGRRVAESRPTVKKGVARAQTFVRTESGNITFKY